MGCMTSSEVPELSVKPQKSIKKDEIAAVSEDSLPHIFRARYQLGKVLGKGAFATVKLARNKTTGMRCAVKIVDRPSLKPDDEVGLRQEVSIMQTLKHPNVVQLLDFFEEEKTYYLVLELMEGGELFDRVVKKTHYNEKEARDTVKVLVEALGYCHDNDVVHRDLKPENLLLSTEGEDAILKIADFGFAKKDNQSQNMLTTQCGTPAYISPEILQNKPYGKYVDMWAVGVITYILLGGYPPFHDKDMKGLFRKIKKGEFTFHPKYWDKVTDDAKDLISKLLTIDTTKRLTAAQVLAHPWLTREDNSLSVHNLADSLEEFKKFNASRKLKAAVRTVMVINRLNRMFGRSSRHVITDGKPLDAHTNQPLDLSTIDEVEGEKDGEVTRQAEVTGGSEVKEVHE